MQQPNGGGGGGAMAPGGQLNGGFGGGSGELIRSLLNEVRPGDLITSDFMRRLLQALAGLQDILGQLDDSVGIGKVPDVIFLQLPQALSILRGNDPPLKIEGVYDTFGNRVAVGDADMKAGSRGERIVLAQFPVPNAKITGDKSVKLLVSTEANRWLGMLDVLMDKGPDLWEYFQTRNRGKHNSTETPGGTHSPDMKQTEPAAAASTPAPATAATAPATSSAAGAPPADDTAALKPTKTAAKARARSKPAKPVGG